VASYQRTRSLWTRRSVLSVLAAVSTILIASSAIKAAERQILGVLADLVEADAAAKLKLSTQQQADLNKLASDRENDATDLAAEIKGLSPEEKEEKLAPFRKESENQALDLLNDEQKAELKKFRLAKAGLAALVDPELQIEMDLTEPQKVKLKEYLASRDKEIAKGDPGKSRIAKQYFDLQMAQALSPKQRETWKQLSGETLVVPGSDTAGTGDGPPDGGPAGRGAPARPRNPGAAPKKVVSADGLLRFNFRFAPWEVVLEWFAVQADLSLEMDAPPPGTFNLSNAATRGYTPTEALDVINSVLLIKGYTLVRRDQMLFLVNTEDGVPPNLVREVTPKDMEKLGDFELVRMLFTVKKMTPIEAEAEIQKLLGPQGSVVVLPRAGQIQVTEVASRLRTIARVIDSIENPGKGNVHAFTLDHVTPDDFMTMARPLLGLAEDQNANTDGTLRIALDHLGGRLLVTGSEEMVQQVDETLKVVDLPAPILVHGGDPQAAPQLEVYPVSVTDPTATLQVMQTLLAGLPDVRLAIDPKTGNLIALAPPLQHATIRATLKQMESDANQIEVIRLRTVDPQLAVLMINNLFQVNGEAVQNAPKVDAEPISRQLVIRGTTAQIDQIRSLLVKMGETDMGGIDGPIVRSNVRMLPLAGRTGVAALDQLQQIWPGLHTNKIRVVTPSSVISEMHREDPTEDESNVPDLRLPPDSQQPEAQDRPMPRQEAGPPARQKTPARTVNKTTRRERSFSGEGRFVLTAQNIGDAPAVRPGAAGAPAASRQTPAPRAPSSAAPASGAPGEQKSVPGAPIIVAPGPGGLMIASQDLDALDEFERLLNTFSSSDFSGGPQYTVFYLKYTEAAVAADLLNSVFGTGGGGAGGGGDSLFGGLARSALGDAGGGLMGSLLGLDGGGGITSSGTVKILAEPRLNALIVEADPQDLDTIDQLLKVIDRETGPIPVETVAKPRLIPVRNTNASEVLTIVQQIYRNRLLTGEGGGGNNQQPSPEQFIQMLRGGRGRGGRNGGNGGGAPPSDAQKMKIGLDARTNSLIVIAPDPLFEEVKALVEQLDHATAESQLVTTRVVRVKQSNAEEIHRALSAIMGNSVRSTGPPASSASPTPGIAPGAPPQMANPGQPQGVDAAAAYGAQMRDMIQQRLQQGAGGRGNSGGGRGSNGFGGGRGGGSSFGGRGSGGRAGGGRGR